MAEEGNREISQVTRREAKIPAPHDTGITSNQQINTPVVKANEDVQEVHAASKVLPSYSFQNVRPLLVRALLSIVIFVLVLVAIRYTPTLAVFALTTLMSYGGARSIARRAREASWLSRWSVVRFVRGMRKAFGTSPVALTLYAVCFLLASIAGGLLVLTQSPVVFTLFGVAIGVVLCAATSLDWYTRLKYILSISVIKLSAKLVFAFLVATTVFVSTVIAKQLTHSIALADPSSMPEFVRLASAFVFPFALSAILSLTLSVFMFAQYLVLFAGLVITMPIRYAVASFSPPMRTQLVGIGYRVLNGRRPQTSRPWWDHLVDGVQHFLRPVGTGAIAAMVILLGIFTLEIAGKIPEQYMQKLLVKTEYRTPHLCENVLASANVAYLQDGYVSVATPQSEGYKFSVEKCHKQ